MERRIDFLVKEHGLTFEQSINAVKENDSKYKPPTTGDGPKYIKPTLPKLRRQHKSLPGQLLLF